MLTDATAHLSPTYNHVCVSVSVCVCACVCECVFWDMFCEHDLSSVLSVCVLWQYVCIVHIMSMEVGLKTAAVSWSPQTMSCLITHCFDVCISVYCVSNTGA